LSLVAHRSPPPDFDRWKQALNRNPAIEPAVPEICYYEVRRELARLRNLGSLRDLDRLRSELTYLPITTPVILRATELWAEVRQGGRPTASDDALDGDVILAATAQLLVESGDDVLVATTNVRHLERFVPAAHWRDINV
jgi:predicted nucleic acid-binding protein